MAAQNKKTPEVTKENIVPDRDIKPVMDQIDTIIAEAGPAPEEAPVEEEVIAEEVPVEEAPEGEDEVDLAPLMDTLGASEDRARMLYDAAQQLAKTEGKTPQELAEMIAEDFDILMQLEMIAARGEAPPEMPGAMGGPPVGAAPPVEAPAPVPAEMENI
jgi:hypothetical protein